MRIWHWATGAWVVSVVSGTVWSVHRNFPWDTKESPLLQVAGVSLVYAIRVTLFGIPGGLILAGLNRGLERIIPDRHGSIRSALVFLSSVAIGMGVGLLSQQSALAVLGALAGATGAVLGLTKLPASSLWFWLTILVGSSMATVITW